MMGQTLWEVMFGKPNADFEINDKDRWFVETLYEALREIERLKTVERIHKSCQEARNAIRKEAYEAKEDAMRLVEVIDHLKDALVNGPEGKPTNEYPFIGIQGVVEEIREKYDVSQYDTDE